PRANTTVNVTGGNIPTRCFPEKYLLSNPPLGSAVYNANLGRNNYHSMQAQLTMRPPHGMSFQSTYTWAKSGKHTAELHSLPPHPHPLSLHDALPISQGKHNRKRHRREYPYALLPGKLSACQPPARQRCLQCQPRPEQLPFYAGSAHHAPLAWDELPEHIYLG